MKILNVKGATLINRETQKLINGGLQQVCDDRPECYPPRPVDCTKPSCRRPNGMLAWCIECLNKPLEL